MLRRTRVDVDRRLIAVLVVLAAVLTMWQHRSRAAHAPSAPERLVVLVVSPLARGMAAVGLFVHDVGAGFGRTYALQQENRKLRDQIDELEAQKLRLTEAFIENQKLQKELGFTGGQPPEGVPARVIGRSMGPTRKRLFIAPPPGRKLEVGNIVRTPAGLVGRVVDAQRGEVFLLVDVEHAVAAVVQRSRDQGMVGVAPRPEECPDLLVMDKLIGRADVREGDVVLTSGVGEVYPPGIPIGVVTEVRRSTAGEAAITAIIRPFVDFDRLAYVLVQRHGK